jgi:hypothetical protein
MAPTQDRRSWLPRPGYWMVIVVVAAVYAVFVLPWLVPTQVRLVASDAQAVGFSNRVAMLGLIGGIAALALLSHLGWRLRGDPPLRLATLRPTDGRLGWVPVAGLAVLAFVFTVATAVYFRGHTHGDVSYLIDRTIYAIRGFVPYRDYEFSYGPALLYMPAAAEWVCLRLGVNIWWGYYAVAALWAAFGVVVLASIVDRLVADRWLKLAMFLGVGAVGTFQITPSLSHGLARYMLPVCVTLLLLGWAQRRGTSLAWLVAVLGAPAILVAVSPELGIEALAGTMLAVIVAASADRSLRWVPLVAIAAVAAGFAALLAVASTLASFASGAFYLPVMPGPVQLLFVAGALTAAWALARISPATDAESAVAHAAWLGIIALMVVPAFGRADLTHIVFDGLPLLLIVPTVVALWKPWLGRTVTILLTAVMMAWVGYIGYAVVKDHRTMLATNRAPDPANVPVVTAPGRVAFLAIGDATISNRLLTLKGLAPAYSTSGDISWDLQQRTLESVAKAEWLIIPTTLYDGLPTHHADASGGRPPMTIRPVKPSASMLIGFPDVPKARNRTLDGTAAFALQVREQWSVVSRNKNFVLLRNSNPKGR